MTILCRTSCLHFSKHNSFMQAYSVRTLLNSTLVCAAASEDIDRSSAPDTLPVNCAFLCLKLWNVQPSLVRVFKGFPANSLCRVPTCHAMPCPGRTQLSFSGGWGLITLN
jgi:hypothetical protein